MNTPTRQFVAIARLTTVEATRQPICLLLVVFCVTLIGLFPFLITHTLGGAGKLVRDSALAVHLLAGLVLGSYAACSALIREIHRGTASSVLSKPIGRGLFFTAKFAGIAALMISFSVATVIATVLSTRVAENMDHFMGADGWVAGPLLAAPLLALVVGGCANYWRQRSFNSVSFGALLVLLAVALVIAVLKGTALPVNIVPAGLLVTVAILMLSAISVSLAPKLDMVPTTSICAVLLMLGLISDYLLGHAAGAGQCWAIVIYTLLPNWQHFWVVDALNQGDAIALPYVLRASLYAFLYMGAVLTLGAWAFKRMELK